jgi:hypothetical protein
MLEKYRKTMTEDIVHAWAEDAQTKIDRLTLVVQELTETLGETYALSPEGRAQLQKMRDAVLS